MAFRIQASGTHEGAVMGVPASGRKIPFTGIHFTRKDGKVVEE